MNDLPPNLSITQFYKPMYSGQKFESGYTGLKD